MFDFNNPNAQRRPMPGPMDATASTFAAPAPITPFMEMPAPPLQGGSRSGGLGDSIGALAQLGAALGKRGDMASKSVDAPMQKSRRPFNIGPPFNETNA